MITVRLKGVGGGGNVCSINIIIITLGMVGLDITREPGPVQSIERRTAHAQTRRPLNTGDIKQLYGCLTEIHSEIKTLKHTDMYVLSFTATLSTQWKVAVC